MPGAPVPSRSVQNGARMLFGRAGSGIWRQAAAVVVLRGRRRRPRGSRWSPRRSGCRSAAVDERRHVEVERSLVADRGRRDPEARPAAGSRRRCPGAMRRHARLRAGERDVLLLRRQRAALTVAPVGPGDQQVAGRSWWPGRRRRRRTSCSSRSPCRCWCRASRTFSGAQLLVSADVALLWHEATGRCSVGSPRAPADRAGSRRSTARSARRRDRDPQLDRLARGQA